MEKKVKGVFFVDYVRMIRRNPSADWNQYLRPEDRTYLTARIIDDEWYPFDTFERLGIGIMTEIARGDMSAAHLWGRASVDGLSGVHKSLVCAGDPMESLMRFQVLRTSFFNFDPVRFQFVTGNSAKLEIGYGMCGLAEEAATHQALGYFERILELSSATNIEHQIGTRMWTGDDLTRLELTWQEG